MGQDRIFGLMEEEKKNMATFEPYSLTVKEEKL